MAETISDMVAQVRRDAEFDDAMGDPAYRADVEQALDEAEADRLAGRFSSVDDVMTRLRSRIASKDG